MLSTRPWECGLPPFFSIVVFSQAPPNCNRREFVLSPGPISCTISSGIPSHSSARCWRRTGASKPAFWKRKKKGIMCSPHQSKLRRPKNSFCIPVFLSLPFFFSSTSQIAGNQSTTQSAIRLPRRSLVFNVRCCCSARACAGDTSRLTPDDEKGAWRDVVAPGVTSWRDGTGWLDWAGLSWAIEEKKREVKTGKERRKC